MRRIMQQLRHDPRTIVLLLVVPSALVGLLAWSLQNRPGDFDQFGPRLLGIFPLTVMFLVTSVTTLRERTNATLERLLTMPLAKAELILGYAGAFGLVAVVQSALVSTLSYTWFGLSHQGVPWRVSLVALCAGLLGTSFGLALSALATTEFQAVQFMPAFILPQLLLCGLIVPLAQLPDALRYVADVVPMSAAVHAITPGQSRTYYVEQFAIMLGYIGAALMVGSTTLGRRTK
ncbi:MAG: ABC transporter permease [Acidimicrobiaceae bacterium]|nr:ABC transporter permease [Acidimicrobiaceae bacterium]